MNARSVGGWPDLLHAIVRGVNGYKPGANALRPMADLAENRGNRSRLRGDSRGWCVPQVGSCMVQTCGIDQSFLYTNDHLVGPTCSTTPYGGVNGYKSGANALRLMAHLAVVGWTCAQ
jgi:hypothetical protein